MFFCFKKRCISIKSGVLRNIAKLQFCKDWKLKIAIFIKELHQVLVQQPLKQTEGTLLRRGSSPLFQLRKMLLALALHQFHSTPLIIASLFLQIQAAPPIKLGKNWNLNMSKRELESSSKLIELLNSMKMGLLVTLSRRTVLWKLLLLLQTFAAWQWMEKIRSSYLPKRKITYSNFRPLKLRKSGTTLWEASLMLTRGHLIINENIIQINYI